MARIHGILNNASGVRPNTKIVLEAAKTTSDVVIYAPDQTITTDASGNYDFECKPSFYNVTIIQPGFPREKVGIIQVYSDSVDGSLNEFLTTFKPDDLTPQILKDCIAARDAAEAAAKIAQEESGKVVNATKLGLQVNNLHTTRDAITWKAGLYVEDPAQLYVHDGVEYLPNPKAAQFPFTTGATFNHDNWVLSELMTVKLSNKLVNAMPFVSFIFDDGYESHYSKVVPEFKKRGLTCGFALVPSLLNDNLRVTTNQMLEAQRDGFEIINHSLHHVNISGDTYGFKFAETEINGGMDELRVQGFDCKGFVAAYSVVNDQYKSILPAYHQYAFTAPPASGINNRFTDKYSLNRVSFVGHTLEQLKGFIDNAIDNNSYLCFYEHDMTDSLMMDLVELLDYCKSKNVDVVNPIDAITRTNYLTDVEEVDVYPAFSIDCNIDKFSVIPYGNSAQITNVTENSARLDINGSSGYVLLQASVNVEKYAGNVITFSISESKTAGSVKTNNTIGINAYNSSGTKIDGVEQGSYAFDSKYRRFYVTCYIPEDAKTITVFQRIYPNGSGIKINLKDPAINISTSRMDIGATPFFDTAVNKILLPSNTLSSTWGGISLTNRSSELWEIVDGSSVNIKQNCTLRFSLTLCTLESQQNGLGLLRVSSPSDNRSSLSISPISIHSNGACGNIQFTSKLKGGDSVSFGGLVRSGSVTFDGNLNSLEINEL